MRTELNDLAKAVIALEARIVGMEARLAAIESRTGAPGFVAQAQPPASGWTCPRCGSWQRLGGSHVCNIYTTGGGSS